MPTRTPTTIGLLLCAGLAAADPALDIGAASAKGSREAKLVLMEFSDYQCPFCKRHAETTLPQIDREYIATGKLRYVFRDFPLEPVHANAVKAAEAARCAGDQGKYWEMHDRLFASQQALGEARLLEHGLAIGLAPEPFQACLKSGKHADEVRQDMAAGRRLGITGTPTLLLGVSDGGRMKDVRILRGASPFTALKQEIDRRLNGMAEPAGKTAKN